MWDFMWCMASALVDSNFSKQISQMWLLVRDFVADRALVCLGEGAEATEILFNTDPEWIFSAVPETLF